MGRYARYSLDAPAGVWPNLTRRGPDDVAERTMRYGSVESDQAHEFLILFVHEYYAGLVVRKLRQYSPVVPDRQRSPQSTGTADREQRGRQHPKGSRCTADGRPDRVGGANATFRSVRAFHPQPEPFAKQSLAGVATLTQHTSRVGV
jgi:hypothetical protein